MTPGSSPGVTASARITATEGGRMAKGHKDKVAVITGAANGIGQAFAKRLAEDGVHIAIADIAPADETVKMVEQAGRQALACQCDVRRSSRSRRWRRRCRRNSAAATSSSTAPASFRSMAFEQMKFEDWRRVLSINLDSVFLVSVGVRARHEAARLGPHRQHGVEHVRLAWRPASCITCRARPASSASPGRWRPSSARTASPSMRSRRG